MASRRGILSNQNMEKNCMDYKALPLGFSNSEYSGNLSNPFLQGIKTPKYQMSAPKPASADVVATSVARLVSGNRQVNARKILDAFQREAKEYKPPPVNLSAVNRMNDDKANRQAVSILPRVMGGQTLGSAITKQTIGINSQDLVALQQRYTAHYNKLPRERQIEIGRNLVRELDNAGIYLRDYELQAQVLKGRATVGSPAKRTDRIMMIERAIGAFHLRNSSVNLDQVFGLLPRDLGSSSNDGGTVYEGYQEYDPQKVMSSTRSVGETAYSEALTQQGVAQSSSSRTQPEIEKK